MIHQYKNNGYNIVLDVCSGSVHVVDDMVYDIITLYEQFSSFSCFGNDDFYDFYCLRYQCYHTEN